MTKDEEKIVIRRVPSWHYEGAREAAVRLGVSYAALHGYLHLGRKTIGPEKRARIVVETVGGEGIALYGDSPNHDSPNGATAVGTAGRGLMEGGAA